MCESCEYKYNASQKHESTLLHKYVHLQQNVFEIVLIEVCSSHLYASFGTFCFDDNDFLIFKHTTKNHCGSNDWPI